MCLMRCVIGKCFLPVLLWIKRIECRSSSELALVLGLSALFLSGVSGANTDDAEVGVSGWTLASLVQSSVNTNPRVLASRAAVARAEADVDSARLQFFPTPSISAERRDGEQMEVFSLRQPLWTGGKLTSGLAVAKAQQDVASLSVDEVRYELAMRVASSWADAMSAQGQLDALTVALVELEGLQAMMRRRQDTGLSAESELDLLVSRLAQTRSDFSAIEAQLETSMEQLSQLTGEPISVDQLAEMDVSSGGRLDILEDTIIQRALATHPALARLSAEVDVASSRVKQARAQMMPTFFASYEYQHGQTDGAREPGGRAFIGVEQSFGAGLSSFSGVRSAAAGREAADEAYLAARRDISVQAAADLQGYIAALRRSEEGVLNLEGVERVSESYRRMFLAGKRSWLDLLNMVRERTDVARTLAVARANSRLYAFRVQLLSGDIL